MSPVVYCGLVAALVVCGGAFAGDLGPPGPPNSTMRDLQEIYEEAADAATNAANAETKAGEAKTAAEAAEPRTPISEIPCTISQPGSYYLTQNLGPAGVDTHGITIEAEDVTLDLNGFALVGAGKTAGSAGSGILVASVNHNFAIRNGTIRDWREYAFYASGARNSQFEMLRCYNNGKGAITTSVGNAGSGCTFTGNTCWGNGGDAIVAGLCSVITGNTCYYNEGDGLLLSPDSTATGNACSFNTGDGISVYGRGTIIGNACNINDGDGIRVTTDCRVEDNLCASNGSGGDGAGIHATHSGNAILRNHCTANDRGLDIDNATNYSSQNTLNGNTTSIDGAHTQGAGDLANVTF